MSGYSRYTQGYRWVDVLDMKSYRGPPHPDAKKRTEQTAPDDKITRVVRSTKRTDLKNWPKGF